MKKRLDFAQDWKFFLCLYVETFDEQAFGSEGKEVVPDAKH
jgi:hypothetical protein